LSADGTKTARRTPPDAYLLFDVVVGDGGAAPAGDRRRGYVPHDQTVLPNTVPKNTYRREITLELNGAEVLPLKWFDSIARLPTAHRHLGRADLLLRCLSFVFRVRSWRNNGFPLAVINFGPKILMILWKIPELEVRIDWILRRAALQGNSDTDQSHEQKERVQPERQESATLRLGTHASNPGGLY
jgi:hypothetical protein